MSVGSLFEQLATLETGVAVVGGLTGSTGGEGEEPSGVAGAAELSAASPVGQLDGARDDLGGILGGVVKFESAAALARAQEIVGQIKALSEGSPEEALDAFLGKLAAADSGMVGDLVGVLRQTLETVRALSGEVPVNRSAVVGELLDQILGVIASMEGDEAEAIAAWARSIQELARDLLPVIAQAEAGGSDPQQLIVAIFQRTLDHVLRAFGFEQIRLVVAYSDGISARILVDDRVVAAGEAADPVAAAIADLRSKLSGDFPTFREAVNALRAAERDFSAFVGPLLGSVRGLLQAPIFQPGGLEAYLREQMQQALSVKVHEVQKIDDPFQALFDRIDAAIGEIDLSAVREQVLGFFDQLQTTIQEVDLPNLPQLLDQRLQPVDEIVGELERGGTELLGQVQDFFDGLGDEMRDLLEEVGSFDQQGRFSFDFVVDLRQQLGAARRAIGGDPADPEAPSVAGTLADLQARLDAFFGELTGLLQPVVDEVDSAVSQAESAIGDFTTFLEGLDMPALLEELQGKVAEILDQLAPVDFDAVAEPVIAAIEENRDKLAEIDPNDLNDLLREALKVALDVIISIDFTATISDPLDEGFQEIRKLPAQAIQHLQQRYEQAIAALDQLEPTQLLDQLVAAFDVIDQLLGQVDLATLLAPLDAWHRDHIRQPASELRPSVLLAPLISGFDDLLGNFDRLDGASLIAPLQQQLDRLKDAVGELDLTSWIDDIQAAVERVRTDIGEIRPSELMQPLIADFERLESQLDRFSPSVLFAPAVELAAPLLGVLENVQAATVAALHDMYQAPLQVLEGLQPERLTASIRAQLDEIIRVLESLRVSGHIQAFKGAYFELRQELEVADLEVRLDILVVADPGPRLDQLATVYEDLLAGLRNLRDNLDLGDLAELYEELFDHFMGMLPPFARRLLEPAAFRQLMRQADPTRFLGELDQRFQALKDQLIPIRPQDIAAELDETYDTVLALVDGIDIAGALDGVKQRIARFQAIVEQLRIDFLAEDIDAAVADARAVAAGLSPAQIVDELDAIHDELMGVVDQTLPSEVLAGLQGPLDQAKALITAIDPRSNIIPQLEAAWEALLQVLAEVDFTVILQPLLDKLDGLYDGFTDTLGEVETAFDGMLGAARGALSGGGASVGASV